METMLELPLFTRAASVGTINPDTRTADLVFSTGALIDRIDAYGTRYRERLSLVPSAVRLDRLNAGAPLLDSHRALTVDSILGVVVPGSARVTGAEAVAAVRFSRREAVEPIWQDVRDRIVRSVSVGYRVHKAVEDMGKDGIALRTAVDWEPFELSMVPMAADVGAHVRQAGAELNPCIIVRALRTDDADRLRRFRLAEARGREWGGTA